MQTFPEILQHSYGKTVALAAALISAIGYMGFTASQVLAGAKLTSATFVGVDIPQAVIIMGAIAVVYTALGGIKAVIYTDTVQWIILLSGLSLVGVPFALKALGGWEAAKVFLNAEMLQMTNLSVSTLINWAFSIIPIWFIGMTLYQRIFAAKSGKEAQRAWFIAGLFNYKKSKNALKVVQWMTLVIGVLAIVIALYIPSVLELMLLSYGFMVSGLMAPVLGFLIYKKPSRNAAIASMISGSLSLLVIQVGQLPLPWELDAVVPALSISLLTLFVMQAYYSNASPDAQST
jgi:Na+/proline symporter